MNTIETDACVDLPRVNDYKFSDMVGDVMAIPSKIEHKRTSVQNQGTARTPSTKYACTTFSDSHAVIEMNAMEGSGLMISGEALWDLALELDAEVAAGWYLQKAVDLLRDLKYISGYSKAETVEEAKQALAIGQLICTGTNRCNWQETIKNNIFVPGTSYGHAFCLVGYDDSISCFIAKNSYGPNLYDKGYFYIPYDHFNKLYTKYALVDKANADLVLKHKMAMDAEMIRKAVEAGLLNGKNLGDVVTRRDFCIVMGRLLTILQAAGVEIPKAKE